jgi:uncharacterized protein (DUF305 family)
VRFAVAIGLLLLSAACRSTPVTQSGSASPGAPLPKPAAPAKAQLPKPVQADIDFMQGMIGHHAQALEMTALLYTRTNRPEMKLLAERIDVSQGDEIKMMKTWLTTRGLDVPSEHAHHMGGPLMPGMLTADQMTRLGAARGDEFDRLFLEAMIFHHLGAITMVEKLLASPGAAQESEVSDFASHVDGDQKMEIARMRALLKTFKGSL